jgi:hypothetical protein
VETLGVHPFVEQEAHQNKWADRLTVFAQSNWDLWPTVKLTHVFHAAAQLSWIQSFESATHSQLEGTWGLWRGRAIRREEIDMASTLSVWVSSDRQPGMCLEEEQP